MHMIVDGVGLMCRCFGGLKGYFGDIGFEARD
jgi:hypothetical protein